MTPEELFNRTRAAEVNQQNSALGWLKSEGYKLMEEAADRGQWGIWVDDRPMLSDVLHGLGFKTTNHPLNSGIIRIMWD